MFGTSRLKHGPHEHAIDVYRIPGPGMTNDLLHVVISYFVRLDATIMNVFNQQSYEVYIVVP